MEPVQGAKKGHVKLHGEVLDDAAKKSRLQQFKWTRRLSEAFGDPELRYWMLREGFNRLERIRAREMTLSVGEETIETTIGALFRRDLSQALLLDWHVNSPGDVWSRNSKYNYWIEPTENLFEKWGQTSVSSLTENQDLQLAAALLTARIEGNMTDPARRAAKILKYAGADLVERMFKQTGYTKTSEMSQDDFIKRSLTEHMNVNAKTTWSNFSPPKTVLTFETYSDTTQEN